MKTRNVKPALKYVLALVVAASSSGLMVSGQVPQPIGTWAATGAISDSRVGAASAVLDDGRTLVSGGTVAGAATASVAIYSPLDNSFAAAGQMSVARVGHTATVLEDGRVLIAGGAVGDVVTADLEIFNPADGTTALVGTMGVARAAHAAARLADGTVLLVGGSDGAAALASSEVFDPETNATTAAGTMSVARSGASATRLIDGRVLVAGGYNGATDLASAEIFYAFAQTFEAVPTALSARRSGHAAVLLPHNNSVLIAGGTSAGTPLQNADLFVPAQFPDPYSYGMGGFAATGAMTTARANAVSGPGAEGFAFVAAGGSADAEKYHFATIKTDKDDYAPGERAVITGSGWQRNEIVTLLFQEDPAVHEDYELEVQADANGNIYWDQWAPEQHDFGVRFYLMAADSLSKAQISFTDGNRVTFSNSSNGTPIGTFGTVSENECVAGWVQERQGTNLDTDGHAARTVNLSSTPSGAIFFAGLLCGGSSVSSITIPTNGVATSFSFRIATQAVDPYTVNGNAGLGGSNNASATVAVTASGPTKLTFTTAPFSGAVGQCLGAIGIQTQNASSAPTNATSNTTVNLATDNGGSGAGAFYSDAACTVPVANVSIPSGSNAGSFYYKATARGTGSHNLTVSATGLTSASQVQTINKAGQTITFGALADKTFGDAPFAVTATGGDSGEVVTFTTTTPTVCSSGGANGSTIAILAAGSCTVRASQPGNGDYNAAPDVDRSFTVQKAPTTTVVSCTAGPFTYNGAPQEPCSAAVTGAGSLDQPVTVSYTDNVNAGTATASATYAESANHLGSSDSATFEILKAPVTATAGGGTATYDGATKSPAACEVTGAYTGDLSCTNNPAAVGPDAGTYPVTPVPAGTGLTNFAITEVNGSFTIDKAPTTTVVSCTAGPFTYNGTPQEPCSAAVTGAGSLNQPVTVSYTDNVNAGTATASATYAESANHLGSSDSATFEILKAPVTATAGGGTATYDGATKSPAACEVTGAYTGDLSCTNDPAAVGPDAGTYPVTPVPAGTGLTNFAITSVNGSFTIDKAPTTTVVSCTAGPFTYNGTAQEPCSAAVTGAGEPQPAGDGELHG